MNEIFESFKRNVKWKVLLLWWVTLLIVVTIEPVTSGINDYVMVTLGIILMALVSWLYNATLNNYQSTIDQNVEYFSVPDVRNKLSPFKNLIALINQELKNNDNIKYRELIESEIKHCEESIEYLSKKD